jgi:lysophospholipase L1-like esterase
MIEPFPVAFLGYVTKIAKARAEHVAPPPIPPEDRKLYEEWQQRQRLNDFAGRCRYDSANGAMPAPSNHRVIFFGDSITELWGAGAPDLFKEDIWDRGIGGQSTTQMLARFRADVIDLHPQVVHILGGTNDIAGNTGPTTLAWVEANIESMVELAQAHHIRVVIGAVPPASHFDWMPSVKPADTIVMLNHWLADYAKRQGLIFVDYHTPLDDAHGGFREELSDDGVHPNRAGYSIMTPLALKAIEAARAQRIR